MSLCFNIDFAVGAPHDGSQENGAIYIYLGDKDGRVTSSQVKNLLSSQGFSSRQVKQIVHCFRLRTDQVLVRGEFGTL